MKIRGLVRSLDRQGRVTIPKEMLEPLGIYVGNFVEILGGLDPEGMPAIVIRKYFKGCDLCGNIVRRPKDYIEPYGNKRVCMDCLAEINSQMFKQK
jgi:bifunctional DNA-binding transcriptional regulator/antitoxin component of YhaV-PrlF toxin-antitoxin module